MTELILFSVLLLALLGLAVGALFHLFLRKDAQQGVQEKYLEEEDLVRRSDHSSSPPLITDLQRKVLLETTPALRDVSYTALNNIPRPSYTHPLEESLITRIQERLAQQKMIQMDHHKLMSLLRHMGTNPSEISALILTNPDFSAKILQTVNSAFFGFPEKIVSVGRAITLLGYNHVRSLVFHDYLNTIAPEIWQGDNEASQKIWIHSACVAVCASFLGRLVFRIPEYDFGAIGLLHDIGKYFQDRLEVRGEASPEYPAILQEEQRYGINHALLGSIIAEKWELSDLIVNGIKYHHHPFFFSSDTIPEIYAKPAFVMAFSDLITKVLGYPGSESNIFPILEDYYFKYKINPDLTEIVTLYLIKELDKARVTVLAYSQKPEAEGTDN